MSAVVQVSRAAVWLAMAAAVLAAAAAAVGLWWDGGQAPAAVTSVHGQTVALDGEGLYRYDSVFKAAANRGTDAVMLIVGVPLLAASAWAYRRGSTAGALLLGGALAWSGYLYASLAVGTAYNELFGVYVAAFAASLWGCALTLRSVDAAALTTRARATLPRRTLAGFLAAAGLLTLVVWGAPLVAALLAGRPPELLAHATAPVTEALDLAVIVPATAAAAVLLVRGRVGEAIKLAVPLLVLLVVLLPVIGAQTASQLAAGITFTVAEVAGPIGGFSVLGVMAAALLVRTLRATADGAAKPPRASQPRQYREHITTREPAGERIP